MWSENIKKLIVDKILKNAEEIQKESLANLLQEGEEKQGWRRPSPPAK